MRKILFLEMVLIIILCISIVTLPMMSYAQDPRVDAEREAERKTSKILWYGAGCLLNGLGIILAYVVVPTPSASALVGKSSDYVAYYTDAYRDKAKSIQTKYAWYGCGTCALVYIAYYVVLIYALSSGALY